MDVAREPVPHSLGDAERTVRQRAIHCLTRCPTNSMFSLCSDLPSMMDRFGRIGAARRPGRPAGGRNRDVGNDGNDSGTDPLRERGMVGPGRRSRAQADRVFHRAGRAREPAAGRPLVVAVPHGRKELVHDAGLHGGVHLRGRDLRLCGRCRARALVPGRALRDRPVAADRAGAPPHRGRRERACPPCGAASAPPFTWSPSGSGAPPAHPAQPAPSPDEGLRTRAADPDFAWAEARAGRIGRAGTRIVRLLRAALTMRRASPAE